MIISAFWQDIVNNDDNIVFLLCFIFSANMSQIFRTSFFTKFQNSLYFQATKDKLLIDSYLKKIMVARL